MGVRGLTTYIASNPKKYLHPYELHDTAVVIDGDSFSSNLYKWANKCNSAFGGDYDEFYRYCMNVYRILRQCNIKPYVLLDGGYKRKKLKTVYSRLRAKIGAIKYISPSHGIPILPLLMREAFVEATVDSMVPLMRCTFEADEECAILAHKLDCPVISYDSDYYIFNVKYIPLIYLSIKVYKKINKSLAFIRNKTTNADEQRNPTKQLTNVENNNGKKNKNSGYRKYLINEIQGENIILRNSNQVKTATSAAANADENNQCCYYYMECSLYTIKHLLDEYKLNDNMLPLFATLLGNDFIDRSIFRKFYNNINVKPYARQRSKHPQRIRSILKWLHSETLESAIEKILIANKQYTRTNLFRQIHKAMLGYKFIDSKSFKYFGFTEDECNSSIENDDTGESSDEVDDLTTETEEDNSDADETSAESHISGDEKSISENEEIAEVENEENDVDDVDVDGDDDDDVNEDENNESEELHDKNEELQELKHCYERRQSKEKYFKIPHWISENFANGHLPRYIIDLLHLKLYVNSPQIENTLLPDANLIAIDIIRLMFTLLNYPERPELKYLTRVVRLSNVHTKRYNCSELNDNQIHILEQFLETQNDKDFDFFRILFESCKNTNEIFLSITKNCSEKSSIQLLFISLLYWTKHSKLLNPCYVHSIFVCFIALNLIDEKIEPIRDINLFQKKYAPQLLNKTKVVPQPPTQKITEDDSTTAALPEVVPSIVNFIDISKTFQALTKLECILIQNNLIQYFKLNEKCLRNKHTELTYTIIHCFAEFQSIVFHLNTFNALLNFPFTRIKVTKLFNGIFLHNMYMNLKDRPNILHYLKHHIYKNSAHLYDLHKSLWELYNSLNTLIEGRTMANGTGAGSSRSRSRKANRRNRKKTSNSTTDTINQTSNNNQCNDEEDVDKNDEDGDDDDDDYNDINNRFSNLLKL